MQWIMWLVAERFAINFLSDQIYDFSLAEEKRSEKGNLSHSVGQEYHQPGFHPPVLLFLTETKTKATENHFC